ncbi:MFS transporter [Pontibacter sp. G13]|uniref:MFS transporter n=1 Tax=Pontibacter sp. G13 TaxID=3074898 RepID=UPI00288B9639|nr:MFS transporter [Pontibacter sp. G13]WNJ17007.1 MFS transporter [Pontibacter sp. G13]
MKSPFEALLEKPASTIPYRIPVSYALSKLFERLAYYGFRSLIVLYMIDEVHALSKEKALDINGFFTGCLGLSMIFGGLLGDFVFGNRRAILIGGIVQAIGAFLVLVPTYGMMLTGMALVILGSGLHGSNIFSQFGKSFVHRLELLDSGFSGFYLALNIGAFLASIVIGYLGMEVGWAYGFASAGVFSLLSIIPVWMNKLDPSDFSDDYTPPSSVFARLGLVLAIMLISAWFWVAYELTGPIQFDLQESLAASDPNMPKSMWNSLNGLFLMPLLGGALVLRRYLIVNRWVVMAMGLGIAGGGFWILNQTVEPGFHAAIFIWFYLLMAVAETLLIPSTYAAIARQVNPKYLATAVGVIFAFLGWINKGISSLVGWFPEAHESLVSIAMGLVLVPAVGIGACLLILAQSKSRIGHGPDHRM